MSEHYSIIRTAQHRPLCIALAQLMANALPGDPRWTMWQRTYKTLSPADQARCQEEMRLCRAARRGAVEARVA
jgi:hypothetical protein